MLENQDILTQTPDARPDQTLHHTHLGPPHSLVALKDIKELGSWLSLAKKLSKALKPNKISFILPLQGPALHGFGIQ